MTTTVFLVRHAAHDHVGRILTGRMSGIGLGAAGRAQAEGLTRRLGRERIDAVHSSPRERARETAAAIAGGRTVAIKNDLDEIDFGAWTGQSFADLDRDPLWTRWNEARALTRAPGGETMGEAQTRILRHLERLRGAFRGGAVALVSHCDMIKAAVVHYLGLPLDALHRFEISPASVTTLVIGDWGAKLLGMNEVAMNAGCPQAQDARET